MVIRRVGGAVLALVVLAVVAFVACSENGDEASNTPQPTPRAQTPRPSGPVTACVLVTPEEVATILGAQPPAPQTPTVSPYDTCSYIVSSTQLLQIQICRCLGGSEFEDSITKATQQNNVQPQPITGVGDKAYAVGGVLWVQKGPLAYNVAIVKPNMDRQRLQDLEIDLAKKILERLPNTQ
jgi:hypothetical protein